MFVPILLLAISLSFDALSTGFVYGIRNIRIPLYSKITISIFSALYCAIALQIGGVFSIVFNPMISKLIGSSILILMGVWIISKSVKKPVCKKNNLHLCKTLLYIPIKSLGVTINIIKNPQDSDIDNSGTIDVFESLLLSIALSLDAVGAGIGCSFLNMNSYYIPLAIGLFQISFLTIGSIYGNKLRSLKLLHNNIISVLPGFVLIALALVRLFSE